MSELSHSMLTAPSYPSSSESDSTDAQWSAGHDTDAPDSTRGQSSVHAEWTAVSTGTRKSGGETYILFWVNLLSFCHKIGLLRCCFLLHRSYMETDYKK